MLKYLLFVGALLFTQAAGAADLLFRVEGVQGAVLHQESFHPQTVSVGALTDRALTSALARHLISEYRGSEGGLSSVNGLGSAYEPVSSGEFKTYGWCYQVDGVEPSLMANQFQLSGNEKVVRWFYAYAHSRNGRWIAMCAPADHVPK